MNRERGDNAKPGAALEGRWLLLVFQLPARPSNARVSTWRRLQKVGALPVKNSAYVLPNSPQGREDFEWIKTEIIGFKGKAAIFLTNPAGGREEQELIAAFRGEREGEFGEIRREAAQLQARHRGKSVMDRGKRRRLERAIRRLRERWAQVAEQDCFGAPGREESAQALGELTRLAMRQEREASPAPPEGGVAMRNEYQGRTWVTRPRPGVDRMSSAWLIRRFVDARARFAFAAAPKKNDRAVGFDMYGVEFSHHGAHCTFEMLAERFGVTEPGVERIGQIVHDLDLKDGRYGAADAPAIGRVIEGLRRSVADDHHLLEQGITLFEALYQSFSAEASGDASPRGRAPRSRGLSRRTRR